MAVTPITASDEQDYNEYITQCSVATFEYTSHWSQIISNSFGFKPYTLISRGEDGKINGVLPLFKAKSIFGTRLVSTPYAVQTPIIALNTMTYQDLVRSAIKLAQSENVDYLEIRGEPEITIREDSPFKDTSSTKSISNYLETGENDNPAVKLVQHQTVYNFSLSISSGPEEILKRLPKSSIRWGIKKAQNSSLTIQKGRSSQEISDFYNLFLNTRKKRGVPGYPLIYFKDIVQRFDKKCQIYVAHHQRKPIAAILLLYHQKEVRYAFAGAVHNRSLLQLQPYHLLIWEAIKDAHRDGYTTFNFGGATVEANDGGLYEFKKKWSEEITPIISYFYFQKNRKQIEPNSRLFGIASHCWKHLPLWFIKRIDHYIIRQFV